MTTDARSSTALAGALRPVLLRLGRRLRQVRDDAVDLNPNQLSALGVLFREGDLLIGRLAAVELVRPPSMTRIVNGLEERGLVRRTPHPTDGRQCLVGITEAGRQVLLANRRRRTEWLAARLARLTPEERDVLRRAVDILSRVSAG